MKTVFIIGAGASTEVGLPVGDELKHKIAELLDIEIDFPQTKGDHETPLLQENGKSQ